MTEPDATILREILRLIHQDSHVQAGVELEMPQGAPHELPPELNHLVRAYGCEPVLRIWEGWSVLRYDEPR